MVPNKTIPVLSGAGTGAGAAIRIFGSTTLHSSCIFGHLPHLRLYEYMLVCDVFIGVADPGCFSRIPDPDFYPSRIPDSKNSNKREK
jgi:hypothetical protein